MPGLAILNVHRSWTGWPVIITIIGWLMVIGSVIRLVLPATTATLATDLYSHAVVLLIVALIVLVVGAYPAASKATGPETNKSNATNKQTDDWNERMIPKSGSRFSDQIQCAKQA